MPASSVAAVRKQIAARKPDPVYVIIGDDDAEMSKLAADFGGLIEDELRAFNSDRVYASDKIVTPPTIVESARMLPMMSDRRLVIVLRAEKFLKPKRRGKAADEAAEREDGDDEPPSDTDVLDEYIKKPEPSTTLVMVASDVDRVRKLWKTIQKNATIVECWGLKGSKDAKNIDLRQVARTAEQLVNAAVAEAGQKIDPAAARLIAVRAGTDIATLRGDVERLLLYAAGKPRITVDDVQQVVSAETSQDDWAVTTAIQRGDTAEALRQLALALEAGGVPYQILGQLGWFVRDKMADTRRIPAAVEALFRTDLELKSSAGDPRVLLERLVVALCGR
jgi:DNA polymerase-3 subunit delta